MSKMNELSLAVAELRKCGDALISVADSLADLFSGDTKTQAETTPADPAPKTISLEEVRAVLADKSRKGHTATVRDLLMKHGASKLSDIEPQNYAALLADAEVL